jgi:hypothetical protein
MGRLVAGSGKTCVTSTEDVQLVTFTTAEMG